MLGKIEIRLTKTLTNLSIAKERGSTTVWLINEEYWGKKDSEKDFIDYKIKNLSLFLKEIRLLKNS